jgi:hypothetical protein
MPTHEPDGATTASKPSNVFAVRRASDAAWRR